MSSEHSTTNWTVNSLALRERCTSNCRIKLKQSAQNSKAEMIGNSPDLSKQNASREIVDIILESYMLTALLLPLCC